MSKTVHEIRMEKLRNWEIREMTNRHESKEAWMPCGISLGVLLLLVPIFFKFDLGLVGGLLGVISAHIFVFNIVRILQLEKDEEQRRVEMDLLTEPDRRDV